uniref:NADH-ubiquinone oxidoreductase chain 6 n=1 Tax=Ceutorhynchus obstrictus TaxID=307131 RepID=J9PH46_9CUCU|nr:NADH dehydrogenase subunit 6 [Ceutorhynchus obstrictus]AEP27576.1 NADH dehydrogenase subunit 6 [Ceutorhynchus obstrictus]QEV84352.1 NADH dehydrogenase subunit 6 [Ceutorhynchus obstrictus]
MLISFMLLNMMLSMMFIFMNHPLSLGCMLLMQTILIALISGYFCMNYWFSYILFLIMIGGMLIMFIYMTSIASNEKFKLPKMMLLFFFISMNLIMLSLLMDQFLPNSMIFLLNEMSKSKEMSMNFSLNKLFNYPYMQLILFLMIYLLITLIAVVKIVGKNMGTLRQK